MPQRPCRDSWRNPYDLPGGGGPDARLRWRPPYFRFRSDGKPRKRAFAGGDATIAAGSQMTRVVHGILGLAALAAALSASSATAEGPPLLPERMDLRSAARESLLPIP